MTDIATVDWFGRWGTSIFSENTAIFLLYFKAVFPEVLHENDMKLNYKN